MNIESILNQRLRRGEEVSLSSTDYAHFESVVLLTVGLIENVVLIILLVGS